MTKGAVCALVVVVLAGCLGGSHHAGAYLATNGIHCVGPVDFALYPGRLPPAAAVANASVDIVDLLGPTPAWNVTAPLHFTDYGFLVANVTLAEGSYGARGYVNPARNNGVTVVPGYIVGGSDGELVLFTVLENCHGVPR